MIENNWNAALYENKHAFVWQYGEDLLQLLNPKQKERILDLGCGTGQLTEKIATFGAIAMGIDNALGDDFKAKQNYPHLQFDVADGRNFQVEQPLDVIFSNAALHWIKEPDAVINCVHQALKPGGRFVAEFGGKGNVQAITTALETALQEIGISQPQALNPWYYPSIGEYATRLEKHGFDVNYAVLFARPTPLADADAGMANWIQMFAAAYLKELSHQQQMEVISKVEESLKSTLYREGTWIADYRRIRIIAVKM